MANDSRIPVARFMLHPRYWGAWLVVFFMWLISWLPLPLKDRLSRLIGYLLYKTLHSRTRIGRKNLSACFPEYAAADIERLLQKNLQQMAMGLLETPQAWWRNMEEPVNNARIIGMEHVLQPLQNGQGVLLMSGHFTSVDFALTLFKAALPEQHKLSYMYRPHDNPVIDRMIVNGRNGRNARGHTKYQVKELIRWLRGGNIAWYACDQNSGKAADLFAPFFGVQTANLSAPSWIAKAGRAAVVFMRMHRLPGGVYEIEFSPLPDFGEQPQADCEAWNKALEQAVRQQPDQYFWIHKRFKKRPPGEAPFY